MRLVLPGSGTVVECGEELAARYLARGWRDADAPAKPVKATPEKPKARRTTRTRKSD